MKTHVPAEPMKSVHFTLQTTLKAHSKIDDLQSATLFPLHSKRVLVHFTNASGKRLCGGLIIGIADLAKLSRQAQSLAKAVARKTGKTTVGTIYVTRPKTIS